jgi:hypothetical protein
VKEAAISDVEIQIPASPKAVSGHKEAMTRHWTTLLAIATALAPLAAQDVPPAERFYLVATSRAIAFTS